MAYFIPDNALWLDDRHAPPREGWSWVRTTDEVKSALKAGPVEHLALDNDLGMYDEQTGTELVAWMAAERLWPTASLLLHTGSCDARREMGAHVEASGLFGPADEQHPLGPFYVRV